MLTFQIEPLEPIWDEITAIAAQQWAESDYNIHHLPINLDRDRYFQYNALGMFLMFTARDAGKLAGYAGMYMVASMHTQVPLVTEDTLFLLPEYRKGRNAIRFYKYIEQEYLRIVRIVYPLAPIMELSFTTKLTNGAGRVLVYLDFEQTAMQYTKQIRLIPRADSAQPESKETSDVCSGTPAA